MTIQYVRKFSETQRDPELAFDSGRHGKPEENRGDLPLDIDEMSPDELENFANP